MNFSLTEKEEALRQEVRDFIRQGQSQKFPSELPGEYSWGDWSAAYNRRLGAGGWISMAWPKEYGGQGRTLMEQFIFLEEMVYHKAPILSFLFVNCAARGVLTYGNERLKSELLPQIARGELTFWQGFSEPNAGSDLLGLETRAVEDGDTYIVNGQKVWNSFANLADYGITLAKTDTEAPRHKGISAFLIDMKLPGITVRPLMCMPGDTAFTEIFFDDVRVPKYYLLGEKNRGLPLLLGGLEADRLWARGPMFAGFKRILEQLVQYVKETGRQDDPIIRQELAEMATEIEVSRLLGYRAACMINEGREMKYEASMVKTFADELGQRLYNTGMKIMGLYSQFGQESKWAPLKDVAHEYLFSFGLTLAGGSSEIQRSTIATRGLGLPRE